MGRVEIDEGAVQIDYGVHRQFFGELETGTHRPRGGDGELHSGIVRAVDGVDAALGNEPVLEYLGVVQQRAVEVGDQQDRKSVV